MSIEDDVKLVQQRVKSFAEEMREKGIHLGMGKPAQCVTCGEPWPCSFGAGSDKP